MRPGMAWPTFQDFSDPSTIARSLVFIEGKPASLSDSDFFSFIERPKD